MHSLNSNLQLVRIAGARARLCIAFILLAFSLNGQSTVSVLAFGATADGILRNDGVMMAGSAILTSSSSSFTSSDVGKYIQVIGAGPGGSSHNDGSMASGSATLTSSSGAFAPSDVGRGIVVMAAGAAGGNLVTVIQSYSSAGSVTLKLPAQASVAGQSYYYGAMTLEGTIQSVQGSNSVTLSAPAAATISTAQFAYGTDNHANFQSALDSVGQSGGGTVSVPAPANCPAGAVCGYVVKASDQMTAKAPGAVKIRYSNVSLAGDAPQTNLFCRGAYSSYTNSVAFPGTTGYIRGFCLTIGDNGGPNGASGEYLSNISVANLHLYGMTNGNTFNVNFSYPPQSPTGDGWDVTHKAIYMWDNGSFSNLTIDSVILQDFKAENIYSGGSPITGMVIKNSTITNFNGNGISMLAADLQVLNNTISNGSNAAVENSTVSSTSAGLVRQLYQGNTIAQFPREGIVVVGVDAGVAPGTVQILDNYFDTIGQVNASGTQSAIYVGNQGSHLPPANVKVTGNTCHDCYSFGVFETSGNTLIQGNTFTVDKYNASSFIAFAESITGTTISGNTGSSTANAQATGRSLGSVYQINPGYATGAFPWKNVVLKNNSWSFGGTPQYQFVTTSGLGWGLVSQSNLNWQGDVCAGCTHADANHGLVDLSKTTLIEPYGPTVYVTGNNSPITVTVDATKEENGAQVQIVNNGSNPVTFVSDSNLSLTTPVTIAGGGSSITFFYTAALGKFTLLPGTSVPPVIAAASISVNSGTPQSQSVNTPFGIPLQAIVADASNNPVSGVSVTFSAPNQGASGSFASFAQAASVLTAANGIATAPNFAANSQAGSYSVTATVAGVAAPAVFSLTNTAAVNTANPNTGLLAGLGNSAATPVNLTKEGTVDWEHWGEPAISRKAGVTPQLGNPTVVGQGPVMAYQNDPRQIGWSDGMPTSASTNNANGAYIVGVGQGFAFTAPADTAPRTLLVHVGGWFAGGTLRAHLSDSSAPDYVDVTTELSGQFDRNYTLSYNAGSAGQQLVVSWVMTTGEPYGNVTINAAALAGSMSSLASTAGTPQSSAVDASFQTPLQVTVLDGNSNPLMGIAVSFSAPGSGATATFGGSSTASATTNSAGIATAPTLTAGGKLGSYTVVATAPGFPSPATFALNNISGPPASITAAAGNGQSTTLNTAFPSGLQAQVTDSDGNPLRAVSVTFNAPSPGASAAFGGAATVMANTNTSGIATSPLPVANNLAGAYTVQASVAGVATTAPFNLTNISSSTAASITATAGTPQSTNTSTTFPTALKALLTDQNHNPLSGVTVIFTAPTSGASGTFGGSSTASGATDSNGIASAPSFAANSQPGFYVVAATAPGVASAASFSLTNSPAASVAGGGSLTGFGATAPSAADLTAEGAADWVHWGDAVLNRKSGVLPQISDYQYVNAGSSIPYNNDLRSISWSDGSPTAASTGNLNGLYTSSVNGGFSFTVAATTAVHTLIVHVGGWLSAGTLTAHLSDASAADYVDVTPLVNAQYDRTYTLTFSAASAGQTLKITWLDTAEGGNVTLNGAALR